MNCLLCARDFDIKDETVTCGYCNKLFHAKCLDITTIELKCLKENKTKLRCSICTQAGRKLRSGSTSSSVVRDPASSTASASVSVDHVGTILEELRGIKATQVNIVSDIAKIKEFQAKLADDINARCNLIQNAVRECTLTLDSHTDTLTAHEINLSDISDRIAKMEEKIAQGSTGSGEASSLVSNNKSILDAAIEEMNERERRKFNIIIFKIPESVEPEPLRRKAHDTSLVTELFTSIGSEVDCRELKVHRLGSRLANKDRPVRVVMRSEGEVRKILSNAHKAMNTPQFRNFIISSDKTPRQQSQYQDLKRQMFDRLKKGEKDLRIRYVSGVPKIIHLN